MISERGGKGRGRGEVKQGKRKRKVWGENWTHGISHPGRMLAFLTSVRAELGRLSLKIVDE